MMKVSVILLFSVFCFALGYCEDIKVDLFSYRPGNETTNVFKTYYTLHDDKTKVKIKNINEDIGFFIIQVHSYNENVTLSYNSTLLVHSHVTGMNIGLVYAYGGSSTMFYIFRNRRIYDEDPDIMLVITVYDALDPIPGGCNLSFGNRLAPYQLTSYTEDYILVESQPPSAIGVNCDDNKIQIDMYHLYLPFPDEQSNFKAVDKMVTVDNIKLYGKKIPQGEGYFTYRRLYSNYKRTGQVFAVVATYNNRSSAYVPAVSYGCDINKYGTCVGPALHYRNYIGIALIIFGVFICFLGHKFFRFTLFITGFTFGVLVTYLAISFDEHFLVEEKIVTSLITGFFYGVIWVFIWWKYGVPLLSVHLNFILGGFLIAAVIFFAGLADISIYRSDLNFWVTFACIIIGCLLILSPATMYGHIFSCSLLGSFAFIVAVNFYLDGHMQYIIINAFRRATIKNFNMAVIDAPIDVQDILHSTVWIVLLAMGCFVQLWFQRGKPPFPSHRNGVILVNRVSERTPLIQPENENVPQYV